MKLLFICSNDFKTSSGGGGSQCTNRNYMSLVEIFGTENVDVIQLDTPLKKNIRSIFSRVLNYMKGYNAGVSKSVISNIIERSLYYEHIFIDSSFFGVISKHLKQHNYQGQIISFFHNVEHLMSLQETKTNPLAFWRSLIVYYNEKCAVRFSDQIIMLNDRDLKKLENIYGNFHKTVSHIIPISFKDRFSAGINNLEEQTKVPPVILFLGSTWFPNIHGITWFIKLRFACSSKFFNSIYKFPLTITFSPRFFVLQIISNKCFFGSHYILPIHQSFANFDFHTTSFKKRS